MGIGRVAGAILVGVVSLGLALPAVSQPPGKVFRIGFLANTVPLNDLERRVPSHPAPIMVEEGLKKLGWVDGKNIRIAWKSAEGNYDRLPQLAEELVRDRVDVIIAFGGGVHAAAQKTRNIPIVMVTYGLPVEDGLVSSLARPGGNITGLVLASGIEINGKRLSLLKEAVPGIAHVAFVRPYARNPAKDTTFSAQTAAAAKSLGLVLSNAHLADLSEPDAAFKEAVRNGAQAMVFVDAPNFYWPQSQALLGELAKRHRMPVLYPFLPEGELGGILAYAADIKANYARAPHFVDRILRGAKPGDLPIEQPSRYVLVVNLKAARAIGVTIPASVLAQADRVIE